MKAAEVRFSVTRCSKIEWGRVIGWFLKPAAVDARQPMSFSGMVTVTVVRKEDSPNGALVWLTDGPVGVGLPVSSACSCEADWIPDIFLGVGHAT